MTPRSRLLSVLALAVCVSISDIVLAVPCIDLQTIAPTTKELIACGFTDSIDTELSQNIDIFCNKDPATSGPTYTAADNHCKKPRYQLTTQYSVSSRENRTASACHSSQSLEDYLNPVFIGFHGTQSRNANEYMSKGVRRLRTTSGADCELGEGLYVTDDVNPTATHFANGAANAVNTIEGRGPNDPANVTPRVCMIYAKDLTQWREQVQKFYYPPVAENGARLIIGSSNPVRFAFYEENRRNFAQYHAGVTGDFVRFGPLDIDHSTGPNQFSIPEPLQALLLAVCYAPGDPQLLREGTYPVFNFKLKMQVNDWNIKFQCPA